MDIKRPLMPGFLKKAEQKLLLNKPGIWSSRTHLVLYYGILFMLVLATFAFIDPLDKRENSQSPGWIGFVSIICIIAMTVWLIYLLRFNVFKRYGNIHPQYMLVSFVLSFIATGTIVLFGYVHPVVESVKTNMRISSDEIVNDINAINRKICQFEYKLMQPPWVGDSTILVKDVSADVGPLTYEEYEMLPDSVALRSRWHYRYHTMTIDAFNNNRSGYDSLVRINDTFYVIFNTPSFQMLETHGAEDHSNIKVLNSFDLYKQILSQPPPAIDQSTLVKELTTLLRKYDDPDIVPAPYGSDLVIQKEDNWHSILLKKYNIYAINDNISNITEKKYRWNEEDMHGYARIFYYITLSLSLLVFIFRHSTVKTFFLSLLAGVLLTIFTALVFAFSNNDDSAYFMIIIVYAMLFLGGSLTVFGSNRRNAITGICINLFVFIVPVFPLLCLAWYYEFKQQQYRRMDKDYYWDNALLYFTYAEIAGLVLLLALMATFINRLYRRWYSLPEN